MTPVERELAIDELRDMVQDARLNFLLGAGTSMPFIALLGDTENLLTAIDSSDAEVAVKKHARASVYAAFLRSVVAKNLDLFTPEGDAAALIATWISFLQTLNRLLLRRRTTLLNKQVNLFTTNVDIAIELAAEALQAQLNDGFAGRFDPQFSTSNFGSVLSRRSLQYDNLSEIPTFNLIKLHGSVSWRQGSSGTHNAIGLDTALGNVRTACRTLEGVATLTDVRAGTDLADLIAGGEGGHVGSELDDFLSAYARLAIVNPTKEKFHHTVLNQNYYDLLRLFSNEMEKENALLFVVGFSCRDEHIRELMIRSARANPTLQIIVFAYNQGSASEIVQLFDGYPVTNGNIRIVSPPPPPADGPGVSFDLGTIARTYFEQLARPPVDLSAASSEATPAIQPLLDGIHG